MIGAFRGVGTTLPAFSSRPAPILAVTAALDAQEFTMTSPSSSQPRRIPYILAGLTALLLWAFASVAEEVIEGETHGFDAAVAVWFRDIDNPGTPWGPTWFEEAMRDITGLGGFTVLGFVLIATVIYLAMTGKARTALFVGFAVVGGSVLSTALKALVDRPRPDVEAVSRVFTASFPSGHAAISAVVYLTLGLLLAEAFTSRKVKIYFVWLGVFVTFLVGVSRIYLGVHFPTDVIAGWALGGAWALACWVGYSVLFGHDRGRSSA